MTPRVARTPGRPRWKALRLALALVAAPLASGAEAEVVVSRGEALITREAVRRDPYTGLLRVDVAFPARPRTAGARVEGETTALLQRLLSEGAAGNHRDLYDNRDDGHSRLRAARHPGLSVTVYADGMRQTGLHHGLNPGLIFNTVVFGNSSTAVTGSPLWRSLPRLALTSPAAAPALQALYEANHLYVYPAHRDYRAAEGDLLPANTPFFIASRGSSGSDRAFLDAIASTLAAFRPETKTFLIEHGLVAATLQMITRRSLDGVNSDDDYLSARAHPTAFAPEALRPVAMLERANALRPEDAPPMARLAVVSEPEPAQGVHLFGDGLSERLFDTPSAVARVARAALGVRRYRLSAADTVDPNGRPLRFEWRVLRGPGVTVEPHGPDGREATVTVPWIEPFPAPGAPRILTHRIDVAVFADNGRHLSAPAFFSVAFPPAGPRRFAADGKPLEADYAADGAGGVYRDPLLTERRGWRDTYHYTPDGALIGWQRIMSRGRPYAFTRHGYRVLERDALGRPTLAQGVAYPVESGENGMRHVRQRLTDVRVHYRYAGSDDLLGVLTHAQ